MMAMATELRRNLKFIKGVQKSDIKFTGPEPGRE
jgi:hypothetical protein